MYQTLHEHLAKAEYRTILLENVTPDQANRCTTLCRNVSMNFIIINSREVAGLPFGEAMIVFMKTKHISLTFLMMKL